MCDRSSVVGVRAHSSQVRRDRLALPTTHTKGAAFRDALLRSRVESIAKGYLESFEDSTDVVDLKILLDVLGHIDLDVSFVPSRQDDRSDALTMGREQLLPDTTDRSDQATQGDLTGHGQSIAGRESAEQGDEADDHRDAGRRSVLLDRSAGPRRISKGRK